MMRLATVVLMLASFWALNCLAADGIEIVKSEGVVSSARATGGAQSATGNVLATGANGRAVVRVGSAGYVVMDKNSQIEIDSSGGIIRFFRQVTGVAYFAFNAIKGKERPIEVKTRIYTIGIRGTRFLVADVPEHSEIGMRKGTVSVTSLDEAFEIHRKAEQDEFETFKREGAEAVSKAKSDFEAYKANTQKEFVEYKRELSLGADRMLSFDGKRVDDRPLDASIKQDMESLESYGAEWVGKVQD